jgi:hypothetical protein
VSITYRIDRAKRRVYNEAAGVVRGSDILETQRQLATDPDFEPTFSQLFDLTPATEVDVSAEQIRSMAAATAFQRGARRAIVVDRPLVYGLTRMFELLLQERGGEIQIFADLATAEQWLDAGYDAPPCPDDVTSLDDAGEH